MCLPLNVSGFERYMWQDNRETHPMAFFLRLDCRGAVDVEAFRAAVRMTIERHPLLHARIEGKRFKPARWVASPEPMPYLDIDRADAPMTFPRGENIDLAAENGLRIWVRAGQQRTLVCVQIHHACCDGIGANQFLEDLLYAYDWLVGERKGAPAWPARDATLLPRRTRFGLNWWRQLLRLLLDSWGTVVGICIFYLIKPMAAISPQPPQDPEADAKTLPKPLVYRFSADELQRLLAAARGSKATLNDLMLRDLIWALYHWNIAHDDSLRNRMVRVMVPADLRSKEDEAMPAANIVGMVNIDRYLHWKVYRDPQRLLRSINIEMRYMRLMRFAITFARITALIQAIGRILPMVNRLTYDLPRALVTTVLSNTGRVFQRSPLLGPDGKLSAGGLVVDTIVGAPPQRIYTGLAFSIFTYAGELSLIMNYDRRRFTRRGAGELFDGIVRQIARSAELDVRSDGDWRDAACDEPSLGGLAEPHADRAVQL